MFRASLASPVVRSAALSLIFGSATRSAFIRMCAISTQDSIPEAKSFSVAIKLTDANGIAEFLTIYPGWYPGRAVHIHFKIRNDPASRRAQEFISQLYFDESMTDQVHKQSPYNGKGYRTTTNDTDFGFPPRRKAADAIIDQGWERLCSQVRDRPSDNLAKN